MLLDLKRHSRKLISIEPQKIQPSPFQPRREFDYYELLELSSSIKRNGIIQPITVRKSGEGYELISGERRLRASIMAGLKTVPAIVVSVGDRECSLMCLIENIQRTDLSFFEEVDGIKRLMDEFCLSQQEVAEKLCMAQSTLSNKLRLLKLTPEQREKISAGKLSERHARSFIRLPSELRDEMINRCIAEQMTVAETESAVDGLLKPSEPRKKQQSFGAVKDLKIFTNSITKMIGTMRRSGVDATSHRQETESYIEYTITIPKRQGSEAQQLSVFDLISGK